MTGFGNSALKVLTRQASVEVIGVFTSEREDTPFPYYECEKLHDTVVKSGIALYEGLNFKDEKTYDIIKKLSPEIIIVSSFNQIIPKSIISIPKLGMINIHPSLLPKYRGATPTVWALMNGEEETGVTVHFIADEKVDFGRIIAQAKLKIKPSDTDGSLRFKLAELSEKVLSNALSLILSKDKKMFPLQNESQAAYYPKRTLKDARIILNMPFKETVNKIRAMTPYPGAYLNYKGEKYIVKSVAMLKKSENMCKTEKGKLVLKTLEGTVKFHVAREGDND